MNESEQLLNELLENIKKDIKTEQAKRIIASGKSAKSLKVQVKEKIGILYGENYFYQQENGRRPGTKPPFKAIYDWLQYKKYGLKWSDDKERKSLAFAIMKSNEKKGSYIHRKPSAKLDIDGIISRNLIGFRKKASEQLKENVTTELKRYI